MSSRAPEAAEYELPDLSASLDALQRERTPTPTLRASCGPADPAPRPAASLEGSDIISPAPQRSLQGHLQNWDSEGGSSDRTVILHREGKRRNERRSDMSLRRFVRDETDSSPLRTPSPGIAQQAAIYGSRYKMQARHNTEPMLSYTATGQGHAPAPSPRGNPHRIVRSKPPGAVSARVQGAHAPFQRVRRASTSASHGDPAPYVPRPPSPLVQQGYHGYSNIYNGDDAGDRDYREQLYREPSFQGRTRSRSGSFSGYRAPSRTRSTAAPRRAPSVGPRAPSVGPRRRMSGADSPFEAEISQIQTEEELRAVSLMLADQIASAQDALEQLQTMQLPTGNGNTAQGGRLSRRPSFIRMQPRGGYEGDDSESDPGMADDDEADGPYTPELSPPARDAAAARSEPPPPPPPLKSPTRPALVRQGHMRSRSSMSPRASTATMTASVGSQGRSPTHGPPAHPAEAAAVASPPPPLVATPPVLDSPPARHPALAVVLAGQDGELPAQSPSHYRASPLLPPPTPSLNLAPRREIQWPRPNRRKREPTFEEVWVKAQGVALPDSPPPEFDFSHFAKEEVELDGKVNLIDGSAPFVIPDGWAAGSTSGDGGSHSVPAPESLIDWGFGFVSKPAIAKGPPPPVLRPASELQPVERPFEPLFGPPMDASSERPPPVAASRYDEIRVLISSAAPAATSTEPSAPAPADAAAAVKGPGETKTSGESEADAQAKTAADAKTTEAKADPEAKATGEKAAAGAKTAADRKATPGAKAAGKQATAEEEAATEKNVTADAKTAKAQTAAERKTIPGKGVTLGAKAAGKQAIAEEKAATEKKAAADAKTAKVQTAAEERAAKAQTAADKKAAEAKATEEKAAAGVKTAAQRKTTPGAKTAGKQATAKEKAVTETKAADDAKTAKPQTADEKRAAKAQTAADQKAAEAKATADPKATEAKAAVDAEAAEAKSATDVKATAEGKAAQTAGGLAPSALRDGRSERTSSEGFETAPSTPISPRLDLIDVPRNISPSPALAETASSSITLKGAGQPKDNRGKNGSASASAILSPRTGSPTPEAKASAAAAASTGPASAEAAATAASVQLTKPGANPTAPEPDATKAEPSPQDPAKEATTGAQEPAATGEPDKAAAPEIEQPNPATAPEGSVKTPEEGAPTKPDPVQDASLAAATQDPTPAATGPPKPDDKNKEVTKEAAGGNAGDTQTSASGIADTEADPIQGEVADGNVEASAKLGASVLCRKNARKEKQAAERLDKSKASLCDSQLPDPPASGNNNTTDGQAEGVGTVDSLSKSTTESSDVDLAPGEDISNTDGATTEVTESTTSTSRLAKAADAKTNGAGDDSPKGKKGKQGKPGTNGGAGAGAGAGTTGNTRKAGNGKKAKR